MSSKMHLNEKNISRRERKHHNVLSFLNVSRLDSWNFAADEQTPPITMRTLI